MTDSLAISAKHNSGTEKNIRFPISYKLPIGKQVKRKILLFYIKMENNFSVRQM
jgi:hypothetical protein